MLLAEGLAELLLLALAFTLRRGLALADDVVDVAFEVALAGVAGVAGLLFVLLLVHTFAVLVVNTVGRAISGPKSSEAPP